MFYVCTVKYEKNSQESVFTAATHSHVRHFIWHEKTDLFLVGLFRQYQVYKGFACVFARVRLGGGFRG